MKVTLEFNLPDDRLDHIQAVSASDMAMFLWDFQQYLREQRKYGEPPDDIDKIYEKWFEMLVDNGLDMDRLME